MLLESLLGGISELLTLTALRKSELSPKDTSLNALKAAVGDRLHATTPFSTPCFVNPDGKECLSVKADYVDEVARARHPGAYVQTQWETCQRTHEQCLIDHRDGDSFLVGTKTCAQGSVSDNHIDVRSAEDVQAAFKYSGATGVPLIIQNTGHDYKGRSSAPGSLGLWMHNLKSISFNPTFEPSDCFGKQPQPAVTVGAGVQWGQAYEFAEGHNITLVGGADKTVGVAGGWLQGGGHSALSNTMGLGVDRVLQFKVVTPDGRYRIANECQNEDLFYALRGGGGGTFGVVMEATILASPRVTLQTVILKFPRNTNTTQAMWHIMVDNGLKWANDGWGGFAMANVLVLVNPRLNKGQAKDSLAPLIDFGTELQNTENGRLFVTEFPSWGTFFNAFTRDHVASVGSGLALASRLVSKSNFATPNKRNETVTALLAADAATPGLIILLTAPSSVPSSGMTSVTDAWRSSLYHVTVVGHWSWNATVQEKKAQYGRVGKSIDNLRKITPDAAYLNEADINERNHEVSFWGTHYPELLRIKRRYDPEQLLDCWQCDFAWGSGLPKKSSATIYNTFAFILTLTSHVFGHHLPEGQLSQAAGTGRRSYDIPITTIGASKLGHGYQRDISATAALIAGISGAVDILYTIPINVGEKTFSLNLDTGSSDLWIASDNCHENACANSTIPRYSKSQSPFMTRDLHVDMKYGDSHSGTYASGTIGFDTVTLHDGLSLPHQPLGLIDDTTNLLVQHNASGIIGLGFPAGSHIQETIELNRAGTIDDTCNFILSTPFNGPFVPRLAMHGLLEKPMFAISLDRDTTQIGGHGTLSLGKIPDGVDDASLTWVPVRLYSAEDGGMPPPSFAPNQLYPFRWEIELDGVFLNDKRLPDSVIPPRGVNLGKSSALIDTGNSLLRGPEDVVAQILQKASPTHDAINDRSSPVVPCNVPQTLAYKIGGKMFPVDPRDFVSQLDPIDVNSCHLDNIVPADAPSPGSLFQWNLGTPFFRSNYVVFHYGNLTHPSVDPPRIGFKSKVPENAGEILINAVEEAQRRNRMDGTVSPDSCMRQHSLTTSLERSLA